MDQLVLILLGMTLASTHI